VQEALHRVGATLGEVFTPGEVGAALAAVVESARRRGEVVRAAVHAADTAVELPWETLVLPGRAGPLVLDEAVQLFRSVQVDATVPVVGIRGPLRVLVVLASPEGADGGALLDLEHELATILDAVEPARKHARAHVRILNQGTLAAVREALSAESFHVLHVSCHASPGVLLLEDEQGRPHRVTAAELVKAMPAGRRPAMVVLAGCSTALTGLQPSGDGSDDGSVGGEAALPGLARQLLAAGVPQVLAMTASVTDRYAALLGGRFYRELALAAEPDVLAALSQARRHAEEARRALPAGSVEAGLVEWATPALFVCGDPLPLYDPTDGLEPVQAEGAQAVPSLPDAIPLRAVGEFVGRRAELRTLLAALRRRDHAGVVLHGIGGVGKSSLAAELLRLLGDDAGLVVPAVGAITVDQILDAFGRSLFHDALARSLAPDSPQRELAALLRTPSEPWTDRLAAAAHLVLAHRPVTLLVDNFESNLRPQPDGRAAIDDDHLADFLTAWARTPGHGRLLVTSRFPFTLSGKTHRRLSEHHLGPLSWAETRKLIWRLPGLDSLTAEQQHRAYTDVGGHPRTLEYLDALLRHGKAKFADVTERIERLLTDHGVDDPQRWLTTLHTADDADDSGDGLFGRALAEAVTLTVNDSLLNDLIDLLNPAARDLLVAVAVYRNPADDLAVQWQLADEIEPPQDPARDERLQDLANRTAKALSEGTSTPLSDLGYTPDELTQLSSDLTEVRRPPLAPVGDPGPAITVVGGLGLLTPIRDPDTGQVAHVVHRWTAATLARLHPEATRKAHGRAARYHTWRVRMMPQDAVDDLDDLVEARHHEHAAGNLDRAVDLSYEIRDRLDTWGAWDWEARICTETLAWLPPNSRDAAGFTHQLGIIAQKKGDHETAADHYRHVLAIVEEIGDRAGTAICYHQIGMLAELRGDYDTAADYYHDH
jgi:hypothetical protein